MLVCNDPLSIMGTINIPQKLFVCLLTPRFFLSFFPTFDVIQIFLKEFNSFLSVSDFAFLPKQRVDEQKRGRKCRC